jgi:hypothetical protein
MPKTFYTEHDIEDMAKRGVISLVEDDHVVLTDLARDKARRLGIDILNEHELPPSAPERPYITKMVSPSASSLRAETPPQATSVKTPPTSSAASNDELIMNVRAAVVARLGNTVDPNLLETIIRRVFQNIGAQ